MVLSTRWMQHFQLDVPRVAVCGVQHSMPTRDVAHGTRCTTRGLSRMMHRAGHPMHRVQCTGLVAVVLSASHSTQTPPWRAPLHLTTPPSHHGLCHGQHNLPGGIWGQALKQAAPRFSKQAPTQAALGVPTPSGDAWRLPSLTTSHPHTSRGALAVAGDTAGRGDTGTPAAGQPGCAEPGRKPLQEGSSGLTNKSLTASPEAGGRKQAPWW